MEQAKPAVAPEPLRVRISMHGLDCSYFISLPQINHVKQDKYAAEGVKGATGKPP